jgi:hypothetical protein
VIERIERAAILTPLDGVHSVERPGRHHDVIRMLARAGAELPICGDQGFVTSSGRFVGRDEALQIAMNANQLTARGIERMLDGGSLQLFSEDVW